MVCRQLRQLLLVRLPRPRGDWNRELAPQDVLARVPIEERPEHLQHGHALPGVRRVGDRIPARTVPSLTTLQYTPGRSARLNRLRKARSPIRTASVRQGIAGAVTSRTTGRCRACPPRTPGALRGGDGKVLAERAGRISRPSPRPPRVVGGAEDVDRLVGAAVVLRVAYGVARRPPERTRPDLDRALEDAGPAGFAGALDGRRAADVDAEQAQASVRGACRRGRPGRRRRRRGCPGSCV
jgi:hypothetical protein